MNIILILIYFIVFPFGQLLRFETSFFGIPFAVHLIDMIVLSSIPIVFVGNLKPHPLRKYFSYFWYVSCFSLLLATTRYPVPEILRGSFYLLRFIAYYFFFEIIWNYIRDNSKRKEKILKIILTSLLVTAVFGWFQYFYSPDLRYLKLFNWDDHYYRLTGTILDPGFMGILMVCGVLMSFVRFVQSKKLTALLLSFFFLVTLGFTYSRASFIALVAGLSIFLWRIDKLRYVIIGIAVIASIVFLLPKGEGEGVNLLRTNSIFEKMENYQETSQIISDFPLFGVGFNTLCSERMKRFKNQSFESHSCSGSDSSILFILATTGIIGLFVFIQLIAKMIPFMQDKTYSTMLVPIVGALFVHSLFLNSLFYPWVMGVVITLFALSTAKK